MPERAILRLTALATAMRLVGAVLAGYALVQAFILVFSSKDRFRAVGWTVALQIPGAPHTWGIALAVFGLMLAVGIVTKKWLLAAYGAWLAGLWSMFFAISFLVSAVQFGQAGLTGIPTYFQNALIFAVLGVALSKQRT